MAAMIRWATATPGPVYLRLGRETGPDVFESVLRLRTRPREPAARGDGGPADLDRTAVRPGRWRRPRCWATTASPPASSTCRRSSRWTRPRSRPRRPGAPGDRRGAHCQRRPRRADGRDRHGPGPAPLVRIGLEDSWGESAPNAFLLDPRPPWPHTGARGGSRTKRVGSGLTAGPGLDPIAARFRERDVWG